MAIQGGPSVVTNGLVFIIDSGSAESVPTDLSQITNLVNQSSALNSSSLSQYTFNEGQLNSAGWPAGKYTNFTSEFVFVQTGQATALQTIITRSSKGNNFFNITHSGPTLQVQFNGTTNSGSSTSLHPPYIVTSSGQNIYLTLQLSSGIGSQLWVNGVKYSSPYSLDWINGSSASLALNSAFSGTTAIRIKRFTFYTRTLSDSEVQNNYNSLKSRFGL